MTEPLGAEEGDSGTATTRDARRGQIRSLPWRDRPRRTLWSAIPDSRFVVVLLAYPYIGVGALVYWAVRGWRPAEVQDLPLMIVLSTLAVVETALLVLWLRRPRYPSSRTPIWRRERSTPPDRHR